MTSRILKGLYHFTVYAVGILVLLAAVTVTLVRLFLPDIGIYRNEVQAWVSKYMGFPVVFHTIDATWQGWVPELTLTDIDLLNKAGTQEITHFDKARIQIAPLATLVARQFIPKSLIISGFKLSVIRRENGAISIQDIELENMNEGQSDSELSEWLFKQDEVEIQNAQIEWIDLKYKQDEPILLTNVAFIMRNDVGRFQVDGSTNLPASFGTTMDFAFDVYGNLLSTEWSGELYLSANDINPDEWYRNIRPPDFNLAGGNADIKVWMNWNMAKLDRLQGRLQYDDFTAMIQDEKVLHLANLTTRFLGEKTDTDGWLFNVQLENFTTDNGAWPDADISITAEPASEPGRYHYITNFSYLKVGDLAPVLSNMPFMPEQARNILNEIAIDGDLYEGALHYNPDAVEAEQFYFATRFEHLSTNLGDNLPAFTNLSGQIQGTLAQGSLTLQDSKARFAIQPGKTEEIDITELTGNIQWRKHTGSWYLQTDKIHFDTPDVSATIAGSVLTDSINPPFLDLVMNIEETDLERIASYLPVTPRFNLKPWMEKAFRIGKVNSASALIRGHLKDFPFTDRNGRFQIIADISDAELEYSQFWPAAAQLDGEFKIDGKEMQAHIANGKIFNAEITTADVTITDILKKEKTVMLEGHINGGIQDLTSFIDQSPLQNHITLGEIRNAMQSGKFGLDLKLGIPVKQPGVQADVAGTIGFIDTALDAPAMKLHMENINGKVSFTRDSINSESLTADYLKQPVTISLSGSRTEVDHPYTVSIIGESDAQFLLDRLAQYVPLTNQLQQHLQANVSGATPWQVQLSYILDEQSNLNKHLKITSELKGLEINLPGPAGKRKYASAPVAIETVLSPANSQDVRITYNSDIFCHLLLDKQADIKLQLARLTIGKQPTPESSHKFLISGRVDNLSVSDWIDFLDDISSNEGNSHPLLNDIELNLDIAHLDLFQHDYFDIAARGSKSGWGWSFNLDAEEIQGDIYLPKSSTDEKQLTLLLNRLYINGNGNHSADAEPFDPGKLPVLTVQIDEFKHLGRDLGQLILQSSKIYNGASIDQFEFRKDNLLITGNGTWLADGDVEQSKFKINLHADNMISMFETFGYDLATIKDGEMDFQIIADWSGSPMDFALANLNGRLDMQIKNGQLLDINPSAGRLFGLFSFQTLPRRLLLDFTDLFGKGLRFDNIEGNFDISNGNAYTNNLLLNGPAANVSITGRTGLAVQDYDQIVTVTPQITASMPIAGAIFGPVGIGVGAAIYLVGEMFNSLNNNIDGLLQHQYTITGSWDKPVIEKIKESEIIAGG